ncbi:MAG: hypothetical protein AB1330_07570 [Bacillota bacterium]
MTEKERGGRIGGKKQKGTGGCHPLAAPKVKTRKQKTLVFCNTPLGLRLYFLYYTIVSTVKFFEKFFRAGKNSTRAGGFKVARPLAF